MSVEILRNIEKFEGSMMHIQGRNEGWQSLAGHPSDGRYRFPEQIPAEEITKDEVEGFAAISRGKNGDAWWCFERVFADQPSHAAPWAQTFYAMGRFQLSSMAFCKSADYKEQQAYRASTWAKIVEPDNLNDHLNSISVVCNRAIFTDSLIDEMTFNWDGDRLIFNDSVFSGLINVGIYIQEHLKSEPLLTSKLIKYLLKVRPQRTESHTSSLEQLTRLEDTEKGQVWFSEFKNNITDIQHYLKLISNHAQHQHSDALRFS